MRESNELPLQLPKHKRAPPHGEAWASTTPPVNGHGTTVPHYRGRGAARSQSQKVRHWVGSPVHTQTLTAVHTHSSHRQGHIHTHGSHIHTCMYTLACPSTIPETPQKKTLLTPLTLHLGCQGNFKATPLQPLFTPSFSFSLVPKQRRRYCYYIPSLTQPALGLSPY